MISVCVGCNLGTVGSGENDGVHGINWRGTVFNCGLYALNYSSSVKCWCGVIWLRVWNREYLVTFRNNVHRTGKERKAVKVAAKIEFGSETKIDIKVMFLNYLDIS